ncbi:MAG: phosphate acyltransferase [bacterium]
MNTFLKNLQARIASKPLRKIILPESGDERIIEAAKIIVKEKIAIPVFFKIEENKALALSKLLLELRASKVGTKDELTSEMAHTMAHDPLMYGMYLLRIGEGDGLVAGASHTSAEVLRSALWLIEKATDIQTISSSFYMVLPTEQVLTFSDCAVVPQPTSEQLADIAIAASDARSLIVGDEPKVALLSYSTKGSGNGESVIKVKKALELVQAHRPNLIIDGEIQADAALIKSISERKAPGSILGGGANVLVFPSLDSANIAYKLVEQLVPGVLALGPILQGFKKPVSDLSRGVQTGDIVGIITIVASQVQN